MTIKNLKPMSPEDWQYLSPVFSALQADPNDVIYCMVCDGLRVKGHVCRCFACGLTLDLCKCVNHT
jgi:hypothetical protein